MHYFELGYQCYLQRNIREAVDYFRRGLACGEDPECAARDRWMTMMLAGEFDDAWIESDRVLARRKATGESCSHLPRHMRFVWDGTPLAGRDVLIRCYHGLGDVIQFIRYAAILKSICRRVRVQAQPELLELLASVAGIDELCSLNESDPEFEIDIELLEVPHALRTAVSSIPAAVPYLSIDPQRVTNIARELASERQFRIGLAWASGEWKPERSVPLSCFTFLSKIPGISVIGLQRGPATETPGLSGPNFVHSDWRNTSVPDTAATILNLDLVISTDTMVAHLAGALAAPVWTLLHFESDWRWMIERTDSPWYPTMRLFRQRSAGDWCGVLGMVKAELESGLRGGTLLRRTYQREGLRP